MKRRLSSAWTRAAEARPRRTGLPGAPGRCAIGARLGCPRANRSGTRKREAVVSKAVFPFFLNKQCCILCCHTMAAVTCAPRALRLDPRAAMFGRKGVMAGGTAMTSYRKVMCSMPGRTLIRQQSPGALPPASQAAVPQKSRLVCRILWWCRQKKELLRHPLQTTCGL